MTQHDNLFSKLLDGYLENDYRREQFRTGNWGPHPGVYEHTFTPGQGTRTERQVFDPIEETRPPYWGQITFFAGSRKWVASFDYPIAMLSYTIGNSEMYVERSHYCRSESEFTTLQAKLIRLLNAHRVQVDYSDQLTLTLRRRRLK